MPVKRSDASGSEPCKDDRRSSRRITLFYSNGEAFRRNGNGSELRAGSRSNNRVTLAPRLGDAESEGSGLVKEGGLGDFAATFGGKLKSALCPSRV